MRYYFTTDTTRLPVEQRMINEIVVDENDVPVRDRYIYGENGGIPQVGEVAWFGVNGAPPTRDSRYLRTVKNDPVNFTRFTCRKQAMNFLGISSWPEDPYE